jgi:hypothetical protein
MAYKIIFQRFARRSKKNSGPQRIQKEISIKKSNVRKTILPVKKAVFSLFERTKIRRFCKGILTDRRNDGKCIYYNFR